MVLEVVIDDLECVGAVVVIGVDHGKRPVDHVSCGEHRVACAPRLGPPLRDGKALRDVVDILENICCLQLRGGTRLDVLFESLLEVLADDENGFFETGLPCIVKGEVHDYVSLFGNSVNLLVSAVPAAHSRSHHD